MGVIVRVGERVKRAVWLPSRRKVYGYVRLWLPQYGGGAVASGLGKTGVGARGRDLGRSENVPQACRCLASGASALGSLLLRAAPGLASFLSFTCLQAPHHAIAR